MRFEEGKGKAEEGGRGEGGTRDKVGRRRVGDGRACYRDLLFRGSLVKGISCHGKLLLRGVFFQGDLLLTALPIHDGSSAS